jgi:hypothetical protein
LRPSERNSLKNPRIWIANLLPTSTFVSYSRLFLRPGSNPTIVSYNASVVNIYNTMPSCYALCVLETKIFSSTAPPKTLYPTTTGVVFVN